MDCNNTGELIKNLRKEKGLTQQQLAQKLFISDKAVSKWERGLSYPDISLLPKISEIFGVDVEGLVKGELSTNDKDGGNMKNLKFYICNDCGNVITASQDATVTCCGKKLVANELIKAEEYQKLDFEIIENEYYISSDHEMTRENYISFVALLTTDTVVIKKQYPEWNLQVRIPRFAHGKLVWYSKKEGLLYQLI